MGTGSTEVVRSWGHLAIGPDPFGESQDCGSGFAFVGGGAFDRGQSADQDVDLRETNPPAGKNLGKKESPDVRGEFTGEFICGWGGAVLACRNPSGLDHVAMVENKIFAAGDENVGAPALSFEEWVIEFEERSTHLVGELRVDVEHSEDLFTFFGIGRSESRRPDPSCSVQRGAENFEVGLLIGIGAFTVGSDNRVNQNGVPVE